MAFRSALFPLIVIVLAVVLLVYVASQTLRPERAQAKKFTTSQLITHIESGDVNDVTFNPNKQSISATLVDGTEVKVNYPTPQSATQIGNLLQKENVNWDSKGLGSSAWWARALQANLLPFVLLIGFWIFLSGGRSASPSASRSRTAS